MIAVLHIQTECKKKITFLKSVYCTPPFKVADITENRQAGVLHLMLMNSSPGILEGDDYQIKLEVAENSTVHLHTQAYQRLFSMKKGAVQRLEVHVAKNASFSFIPHPTVPHRAAHFTATNKIFLSEGSTFIWGEVLTCGRKLNGEVFEFTYYRNVTEIYRNGRLVIKENVVLQPGLADISAIGQWEGYTHQASFIYLNETMSVTDNQKKINEWLQTEENILYGITAAPINGLMVRILGYKAEQLFRCLNTLAELVMKEEKCVQQTMLPVNTV